MARAAISEGIHTMVATPHVNLRYGAEPETIPSAVEELRAALLGKELAVSLLGGAEIALGRLPGLADEQLRTLCLGHSSYALVESPYSAVGSLIEESLFNLRVRGFRPVLAHPERCPEFQRDIGRLERLVEDGVACSISVGSIAGQFGETPRRFAHRLLERGLAHNVSSDAHDPVRRAPALRAAFRGSRGLRASADLQLWLTSTVPAAIVADQPLPPRPPFSTSSRWRRSTARR